MAATVLTAYAYRVIDKEGAGDGLYAVIDRCGKTGECVCLQALSLL